MNPATGPTPRAPSLLPRVPIKEPTHADRSRRPRPGHRLRTLPRRPRRTPPPRRSSTSGPAVAPGDDATTVGAEQAKTNAAGVVTSLTNVTKPTLTVYRPDAAKATGVAVVICPGGGYNNLAWDHEGEQVARWLNSIAVTGVILKYRVPRRPGYPRDQPPPQALMDAQRALSVVRARAADWGVDPKKVGILGFSAGGHLGAWASTNADKRGYEPVDASDKADCRPDFAVLIYPGGIAKSKNTAIAPEIRVTSQTPPTFLAHAGNDPVDAENSILYYLALKQRRRPRRASHLRLRRPRLRPPPLPPPLLHLARPLRGMDAPRRYPQARRQGLNPQPPRPASPPGLSRRGDTAPALIRSTDPAICHRRTC